jgi:predicted  nucleic acid-binding Zn-ribbon protein
MPSSKDGQKRISALELSYGTMTERLNSIEKKLDEVCIKLDSLNTSLEPWKIDVHDNSKAIIDVRGRLKEMEKGFEGHQKSIEKLSDTIGEAKAWLAGAGAILVVLFTVITYAIDKLVK